MQETRIFRVITCDRVDHMCKLCRKCATGKIVGTSGTVSQSVSQSFSASYKYQFIVGTRVERCTPVFPNAFFAILQS
jgi:hypothetical protein